MCVCIFISVCVCVRMYVLVCVKYPVYSFILIRNTHTSKLIWCEGPI